MKRSKIHNMPIRRIAKVLNVSPNRVREVAEAITKALKYAA